MAQKGIIEARGRFQDSPRHLVSTSMFIRQHLLEVGEDYVLHMWKVLCQVKGERNLKAGSYTNFRNYIHWLTRLELIRAVREEPARTPVLKPRNYYCVVPENTEKLALWESPRARGICTLTRGISTIEIELCSSVMLYNGVLVLKKILF